MKTSSKILVKVLRRIFYMYIECAVWQCGSAIERLGVAFVCSHFTAVVTSDSQPCVSSTEKSSIVTSAIFSLGCSYADFLKEISIEYDEE